MAVRETGSFPTPRWDSGDAGFGGRGSPYYNPDGGRGHRWDPDGSEPESGIARSTKDSVSDSLDHRTRKYVPNGSDYAFSYYDSELGERTIGGFGNYTRKIGVSRDLNGPEGHQDGPRDNSPTGRGSSARSERSDRHIESEASYHDDALPLRGKRKRPCCNYRVKTSEKYADYDVSRRLPYKALYMGLVNHTTAHGLPHIHWANGWFKRVFWLCLTLTLTCLWLWQTYTVIVTYLDNGVTIRIDVTTARHLTFPAVTICNQNVARASKVNKDEAARNLTNGAGNGNFRPSNGPPIGGREGVPEGIGEEKKDSAILGILVKEYLSSLDPEVKADYGHQLNDTLIECTYNGYDCVNTAFHTTYDYNYGNCFTFNSGSNASNPLLVTSHTGPNHGLYLILNVQQNEYLGQVTSKAGMRVVIHPQDTPAFPDQNGIDISPGKATSVGIRKVELSRLGGKYGACVNRTVGHSDINVFEETYNWTSYTQDGCEKTCLQRFLMTKCGCYDADFPHTGEAFEGLQVTEQCDSTNEGHVTCYELSKTSYVKGSLLCEECIKPCGQTHFPLTISSASWPATNALAHVAGTITNEFKIPQDKISTEVARLEVYFEVLNYEFMAEMPAYEWGQFLSDVGGSVGLWLGASVMTIFEFLEFFLDCLVLVGAKSKRGRSARREREGRPGPAAPGPAGPHYPMARPQPAIPRHLQGRHDLNPAPQYMLTGNDVIRGPNRFYGARRWGDENKGGHFSLDKNLNNGLTDSRSLPR